MEHQVTTLDRSAAKGVAWTATGKWLTQVVSWGSLLIVARLLSPQDFGLIEMAGFSFLLTNVLAEFGLGASIVQLRELGPEVLEQLHVVSVALFTLAFFSSFAAAPIAAWFFGNPVLFALVIVNCGAFLITGFQVVPMAGLRRDLDYRRLSMVEMTQGVSQALVTLTAAWLGWAFWSLVAGHLFGKLCAAVLLLWWKPTRFRRPHWLDVKPAFLFGWHLTVAQVAGTFTTQSDSLMIGRRLGESPLGGYRMAMNLAYAPFDKVAGLLMRVSGPLFASIQTDHALLKRYYLRLSEMITLVVSPIAVGIALVAPEVVELALGGQWESVVQPLQWLGILMALRLVPAVNNQVLIALRESRYSMGLSLAQLVVMPFLFYLATGWGIQAVAAAWIVAIPLTFLPSFCRVRRHIAIRPGEVFRAILPAVSGCAVMALCIIAVRSLSDASSLSPMGRLLLLTPVGALCYMGTIFLFFRSTAKRYFRFFLEWRRGATGSVVEVVDA